LEVSKSVVLLSPCSLSLARPKINVEKKSKINLVVTKQVVILQPVSEEETINSGNEVYKVL